MRKNLLRNRLAPAVGLVAIVLFGAVAYAAITNVLAVGTISHSEVLDGPATVTFRTISFAPGEVGAWHYHPGPLFNAVTNGTVTVEDGCGGEESYAPGQAFEEGARVHRPKNLGSEPTFAYQMFLVPPGSPTTVNIPGNVRRCGPARSVEECKDGGWESFNHPHSFVSQGDCVQFVLNGKGGKSANQSAAKR
jgi:quercetin dioxygenase-like cupin family protein